MIRAFLDASVLFAAAYSATGFARDLLRLAIREQLKLLISQDVLEETERNLKKKAPNRLDAYHHLLALIPFELVSGPSKEGVWAAEEYVVQKDAYIVAAAVATKADYLVTFDEKHLLGQPDVAEKSGLAIVKPQVVVEAVRRQLSDEEG
jgi:putative PIN family toxin of toxin-antitoxin system